MRRVLFGCGVLLLLLAVPAQAETRASVEVAKASVVAAKAAVKAAVVAGREAGEAVVVAGKAIHRAAPQACPYIGLRWLIKHL